MKWVIEITNKRGKNRQIELQHEYPTADEAAREAEHIADREFTELDETWSVIPKVGQP
jgi:hypothetical protein